MEYQRTLDAVDDLDDLDAGKISTFFSGKKDP